MASRTSVENAPPDFHDGAAAAAHVPRGSGNQHQLSASAPTGGIETYQQNQGTMQLGGGSQRRAQQMSCLYTKHKTQKRKTWHDGRLVLHSMGASLYDAHPPPGSGDPKLDECCLTRPQCDALLRQTETRLETDKFLVQLEGPWSVSTAPVAMAKPNVLVTQGMKKVITRKFCKPKAFVPRHPMQEQQNQAPAARKRQRQPLQPGELQRRYYGNAVPQQTGPPLGVPPAWNQGLQQGPPPPMQGNQRNGRRPAHFQGTNGAQQQQAQNQMAPRYENRSPQPPFQQGIQPQQPYQQGRSNAAPNGYGNAPDRKQYNTPPTAHSHQSTFQQHPVEPRRNSTTGTNENSFVRNKFNPNQFFGEDEELSQEEEDDDDGGLGWNVQQQPPRNPSPKQTTRQNNAPNRSHLVSQPQQGSSKPGDAGEAVPRPREQTTRATANSNGTNENDGNSAALSKNELLKLFGASPVPAAADAEVVDKPAPDSQPEQEESKFEFVLPPVASDSSSDEESDDGEAN